MTLLGLLRHVIAPRPHPVGIHVKDRRTALDVLQHHELDAHYYFPAVGCQDEELADAPRFLGSTGHIITDSAGGIVGKVAKTRLTSDERARDARKRFILVQED